MNLLSWNCWGLGNLRTINILKEADKKEDPKIVYLMEIKSNEDWMKMIRDKCEFTHGLFIPSNRLSGGLAMLWKEEIKLDVQTYSQTHIDALMDGGSDYDWWHLTGFFGNPETSKRPKSWEKLKLLRRTSALRWLVIGDFNELMRTSEEERGSNRPQQQMLQFVEAIDVCGLKDIGFVGPTFTWLYQRSDGVQICERLDRALAMAEWISLFPMAKLHHFTSAASDHSPLLLRFTRKVMMKRGKKLFRFESMWLKDPQCEEVILEEWKEGLATHSNFPLNSCLEKCRLKLDAWNKKEFGHVGKKINELQKHLEWLELQPASPSIIQDMKNTSYSAQGDSNNESYACYGV